MLLILFLVSAIGLISETLASDFVGRATWADEYIAQCDNEETDETWQRRDMVCIQYVHMFREVHLEVLSWSPALVIYRDFLTKKQVSSFIKTIGKRKLELQKLQPEGKEQIVSDARQANGSFLPHDFDSTSLDVFETTRKLIPGIEFKSTEMFSPLSYHPGGHYAPHYDYLDYGAGGNSDWWHDTFGNRVATLIYVFQTAEKGGATVFPSIKRTVRANAGDAFLWFNTRSDVTKEFLSLHGGCPVYSGEKIVTTLWIRAKGQKILPLADTDEPISAEWLIPGFVEKVDSEIENQCFHGDQ